MENTVPKDAIIGQRISQIWQTIDWNPGKIDFADHVFELRSGVCFRLPCWVSKPILRADIPDNAHPWDLDPIHAIRQSAIADICCPENDECVSPDEIYILLESGLWIFQEVGAPHGVAGVGLFTSEKCPWQWPEECGLASLFRSL